MNADYREMIRVADHTEVVIIPKAQYDVMKQALEKFADRSNWDNWNEYPEWNNKTEPEPWKIAQHALETKK